MTGDFISKKDRIIVAAIDIISESGLSALTTKNLAMKENMSETLLYKYYGDMNEVLVDVIEYYSKFDKGIQKTVLAKKGSCLDRIHSYIEAYATYYDNYYAISTLMLQYEELLHNIYTREKIANCIQERRNFMTSLFQSAQDAGEINKVFEAVELADSILGVVMVYTLNRRIEYHKKTFKNEICNYLERWTDSLKINANVK